MFGHQIIKKNDLLFRKREKEKELLLITTEHTDVIQNSEYQW